MSLADTCETCSAPPFQHCDCVPDAADIGGLLARIATLESALIEVCDLYGKAMNLEATYAHEDRIAALRALAGDTK